MNMAASEELRWHKPAPVSASRTYPTAMREHNRDENLPLTPVSAGVVCHSEDEDSSDSDVDLEDVMTTALLENGKQKLRTGDLTAAEKAFKKCADRLSNNPTTRRTKQANKSSLKLLKVAENLSAIYQQQERWADLKSTLTHKVRLNKLLGRKESVDYVEDLIALARVSQRLDDLVDAQSYARKGLKYSMKLHRPNLAKPCLVLLVELCKAANNKHDEEGYKRILAELDTESAEAVDQGYDSDIEGPSPSSPRKATTAHDELPEQEASEPFSTLEDVSEDDDESDTPAAGPALSAPAQGLGSASDLKHNFLDINFDDQISTWSVALDRVFGTGSRTDHDDEVGARPGAGMERLPDFLAPGFTPDHGRTSESTLHDDSDSLSDVSSTGTVHLGIPTRLSHARASLVGADVKDPQPSAATEAVDDRVQPPSVTEHDAHDTSDQEGEETKQTQSQSEPTSNTASHSVLGTRSDVSLGDNSEAEVPDLPSAEVEQNSSQSSTKAEISPERVDSVRASGNTSRPELARKNSWTQADTEHESSLGAYKQVPLGSEGLSRNRASTLQPKPTDPWEEKKFAPRTSARRNGKRASRLSRASTAAARPVLEQTVEDCLDGLAESARCGAPMRPSGQEHRSVSEQNTASTPAVFPTSAHVGYTARMSIDDWQEQQAKQQVRTDGRDLDDATRILSGLEIARPAKPTNFTKHHNEPLRRYSSAFTIEASPQYGPSDHQTSPKTRSQTPHIVSDAPTCEAPKRPDADSVSVIRRTLTSASKVSYATTMSKASSADSSTTVKPDKAQGLSPTISSPSNPPKLVLIGDPLCGKTAIARRFAYDDFDESWGGIGAYNYDMAVTTDRPGQTIQIDFWDTAGQEEFFPLRQLAYDHPQCILICFAIDSRDSFDNVAHAWIQEVQAYCRSVSVFLIGCKSDLRKSPLASRFTETSEPVLVEREQGVKLASSIGAEKYLECSARENDGVVEVFEAAMQLGLAQRTKKRRKRKRKSLLNLFASH